jgi:hypothetical protein
MWQCLLPCFHRGVSSSFMPSEGAERETSCRSSEGMLTIAVFCSLDAPVVIRCNRSRHRSGGGNEHDHA